MAHDLSKVQLPKSLTFRVIAIYYKGLNKLSQATLKSARLLKALGLRKRES